MTGLPTLNEQGVVVFTTAADLDDSIAKFLSRGALAVKPEKRLAPLEQVEVRIDAPFLAAPSPPLRGEVVQLTADRAILRLVEPFDPATLVRKADPPTPDAAPSPDATVKHAAAPGPPPAKTSAPTEPTAAITAAPGPPPTTAVIGPAPASPNADTAPLPASPRAPEPTPPPATPPTTTSVATLAPLPPPSGPPVFEAGALRFDSLRAFAAHAGHIVAGEAVEADVGPGARFDVVEAVVVVVGRYRHTSQLTAQAKRHGERALVKFTNRALVTSALRAIEAGALAEGEDPPTGEWPDAPGPSREGTPAFGTPASPPPPTTSTPTSAPAPTGLTPALGIPAPTGLTPAFGTPAAAGGLTPAMGTPIPVLPPTLVDGRLEFQSRDQLRGHQDALATMGAVIALCREPPAPGAEVDVQLAIGGAPARGRVRCVAFSTAPGVVVVQASDAKAWRPILEGIDSESGTYPRAPGPPPGTAPSTRATLNLPRKGAVENPTSAAGVLRLPVNRPPNDDDVRRPSSLLLLRWLRGQVGIFRLEVVVEAQPVHTAIFVDGREVRTPASVQSLAKALAHPKLEYEVVEIAKPPVLSTHGRSLHLMAEVLRALLARISSDEIERAFPKRENEAPRAVASVVEGLGLPAQHVRFVKSHLTGDERVEDIVRAPGVGARTALDVLYVLELFGALQWTAAPDKASQRRPANYMAVEDPLDVMWRSVERKDHFFVLGLHWSSAPAEIPAAYAKLKAEVGPGGSKRTPANTAVAEKLWKRVEDAYKILNDAGQRRQYRRTTFNLVWSHQAQLLVAKAKLSLYRKDYAEAKGILLAAQDISPSDEAAALLAKLADKV